MNLPVSSLRWIVPGFHSLGSIGLRISVPCCPASSLSGVLPTGQLKAVGFPRAGKQEGKGENKLAGQKSGFYNIILEVTCHHFCSTLLINFCSILLIRNEVQPIL